MAEATLTNVTKMLADTNRDQVKAQKDTTAAVSSLTKTIAQFLDQAEIDRQRQLELDIEARKRASAAATGSSSSSSGGGGGFDLGLMGLPGMGLLGGLAVAAAAILTPIAAFVAATEGLGPTLKDLKGFKGAFTSYTNFLKGTKDAFKLPEWAKPTGKPPVSMFDDVAKNIKTIEDLVKDRFTFDEKSGRWKDLATKNKGYTKLGNVEKYVDDLLKDLAKVEDALPNNVGGGRAATELAEGMAKEGWITKAMTGLTNNMWVKGFLKVLRPIAVILSLFDGVTNAQAEMEDREGQFSKWIGGGLGGFVSGALSSFFGEFLDLLKDAPGWIMKQFVPAAWLNEDGTWKRSENIFTSFMATTEEFSFTDLIRDMIQMPFDLLGDSLDFVRNMMGATGTTAEGQAAAKKQWDDWWAKSTFSQAGDVISFLVDTLLWPVTSILNEFKDAVGITTNDDQRLTFTQNVKELYEWIYGMLPSLEDLKRDLAEMIGPGKLVQFLGLEKYLPVSEDEFNSQFDTIFDKLLQNVDKQTRLNTALANPDMTGEYRTGVEMGLAAVIAERDELAADYQALVARGNDAGISATTINNTSQQIETFMFPNGGAGDTNDPLRIQIWP